MLVILINVTLHNCNDVFVYQNKLNLLLIFVFTRKSN